MIEIKNLCKSFDEKPVLKDVNAKIPDVGIFIISGKSGSGKTTLLRILAKLEKSDSGTIEGLEGKRISVHFQEDRLLPWCTALQNVMCVCEKEKAIYYLKKLEMQNDLYKKPNELSGGMCRRVSLARALAFENDILILDEPFKGLDRELKNRIISLIKDYAKNHCVILITHDEKEMELSSKRLLIE